MNRQERQERQDRTGVYHEGTKTRSGSAGIGGGVNHQDTKAPRFRTIVTRQSSIGIQVTAKVPSRIEQNSESRYQNAERRSSYTGNWYLKTGNSRPQAASTCYLLPH